MMFSPPPSPPPPPPSAHILPRPPKPPNVPALCVCVPRRRRNERLTATEEEKASRSDFFQQKDFLYVPLKTANILREVSDIDVISLPPFPSPLSPPFIACQIQSVHNARKKEGERRTGSTEGGCRRQSQRERGRYWEP